MTRLHLGLAILGLLVLAAAGASVWGVDPAATDLLARHAGPSTLHPLGTDDLGRDVLARVLHGARVSLSVGAGAAVAATALGLLVGVVAAWRGAGSMRC
ncbi:hypothetical protein ACE7GA_15230 [Roseomonas sp. CCTCC AB2023176]|uniref:hypothetical protein n=1 Tax=Roseomonas sp. CCTCC AB2023176 TaxID=3342640 RepID=UPI0035E3A81F